MNWNQSNNNLFLQRIYFRQILHYGSGLRFSCHLYAATLHSSKKQRNGRYSVIGVLYSNLIKFVRIIYYCAICVLIFFFSSFLNRYAMKCLDKKRIKLKQGETLALNERIMLSLVSEVRNTRMWSGRDVSQAKILKRRYPGGDRACRTFWFPTIGSTLWGKWSLI